MEEDGGCDDLDQGDNGWKIIHTDVFRFPPYKSLLCAVLGVGAQFLTLATGMTYYIIGILKMNTNFHMGKLFEDLGYFLIFQNRISILKLY